jgi:multidrug efflux pump subunit AcrA (membrane-fusion protein)
MEENINEVELSTTINDIISKMPHWLIQWGMTVITGIVLIAIIFTYIIKYPEVVEGKVVVTTRTPPIILSSTQNGVIKNIYFDNKSHVEKGDIVAELNSTTTLSEIRKLEQYIKRIEKAFQEEKELQKIDVNGVFLGEKQFLLSELNRNIEQYNNYYKNGVIGKQKCTVFGKHECTENGNNNAQLKTPSGMPEGV